MKLKTNNLKHEKWIKITQIHRFSFNGGSTRVVLKFTKQDYWISSHGRLRSGTRLLADTIGTDGTIENNLKANDGNTYRIQRHQLVAQVFHPQSDYTGLTVVHLNYDKSNNIASNLQWKTIRDAQIHARI